MTIVASRKLTARRAGVAHTVMVTVNEPEPDRTAWVCRFEIGWPEGVVRDRGIGIDGVQALLLALQTVASRLYASEYHQRGELIWEKPGAGYGFPMSRGGRAELIGEDKAQYE